MPNKTLKTRLDPGGAGEASIADMIHNSASHGALAGTEEIGLSNGTKTTTGAIAGLGGVGSVAGESDHGALNGTEEVGLGDGTKTTTQAIRDLVPTAGPITDPSYVLSTPSTGDTVTAAANERRAIIAPAATLAALTLVLPPNPVDGQLFGASCTHIVTTLTVNAGTGGASVVGAPAAFAANGAFTMIYHAADTTWYPAP